MAFFILISNLHLYKTVFGELNEFKADEMRNGVEWSMKYDSAMSSPTKTWLNIVKMNRDKIHL